VAKGALRVSACFDSALVERLRRSRAAQGMALVPSIWHEHAALVFANQGSFVKARRAGTVGAEVILPLTQDELKDSLAATLSKVRTWPAKSMSKILIAASKAHRAVSPQVTTEFRRGFLLA
jgi:hypothetical protein